MNFLTGHAETGQGTTSKHKPTLMTKYEECFHDENVATRTCHTLLPLDTEQTNVKPISRTLNELTMPPTK